MASEVEPPPPRLLTEVRMSWLDNKLFFSQTCVKISEIWHLVPCFFGFDFRKYIRLLVIMYLTNNIKCLTEKGKCLSLNFGDN